MILNNFEWDMVLLAVKQLKEKGDRSLFESLPKQYFSEKLVNHDGKEISLISAVIKDITVEDFESSIINLNGNIDPSVWVSAIYTGFKHYQILDKYNVAYGDDHNKSNILIALLVRQDSQEYKNLLEKFNITTSEEITKIYTNALRQWGFQKNINTRLSVQYTKIIYPFPIIKDEKTISLNREFDEEFTQ